MTDTDFNALGRYTHLCDLANKQVAERQQLLRRVHGVLSRTLDPNVFLPAGAIARTVNFEAVEKLLGEAKVAHASLEATLNDIGDLAPIVDRTALTLA